MAFYFTLSCLRSCVLLGCNCMYVYLATNKSKQKRIEVLNRIKEYILNDPEFHKCTNDSLRLMYKTNLCKTNKDYSEYHKKEHYRAVRFIDALWKEHKNNHEVNVEFFIGD